MRAVVPPFRAICVLPRSPRAGENASPHASLFPSLGCGRLVAGHFRPGPALGNNPAARLTRGDEEHLELAVVLAPDWNCCNLIRVRHSPPETSLLGVSSTDSWRPAPPRRRSRRRLETL